MHVGQPEVAALIAVSQPLVIEAQQVQDCRVQVVDMNRIARDLETDLIRFADRDAGTDWIKD